MMHALRRRQPCAQGETSSAPLPAVVHARHTAARKRVPEWRLHSVADESETDEGGGYCPELFGGQAHPPVVHDVLIPSASKAAFAGQCCI